MASIRARAKACLSRHTGALVVGGLILALSALTVFLMWYFGVMPSRLGQTTEGAKAVIGLVGTFATVAVSLVGLLLKSSFDERTLALKEQAERRATIDKRRDRKAAEEAEERLRVETTARVVDLLTTPDGSLAPPEQQVGALCALANLGEVALALALLERDWKKPEDDRAVDADSAVWILNLALTDKSRAGRRNQLEAAMFMDQRAKQLLTENGFLFPACAFMEWPIATPPAARNLLLGTLLKMLRARTYADWHLRSPYFLTSYATVLANALRGEADGSPTKRLAVRALQILFEHTLLEGNVWMDDELVTWESVREEVEGAPRENGLLPELEEWSSKAKAAPGAP